MTTVYGSMRLEMLYKDLYSGQLKAEDVLGFAESLFDRNQISHKDFSNIKDKCHKVLEILHR